MTQGRSKDIQSLGVQHSPEGSKNRINAGVGGIGTGTGLIAIAQQVGTHTVLGVVLLYLAPAFSIIVSAAIYQLKVWVDWYSFKVDVWRARRTLEGRLKSPGVSKAYKAEVQGLLEKMDRMVAQAEFDRVSQKINHRRSGEHSQPS